MITELKPIYSNQKSFYGKAIILEEGNGKLLKSYETIVASIDENGNFHKEWEGWSHTAANHINEFRQQNGLEKITKKEWDNMEI